MNAILGVVNLMVSAFRGFVNLIAGAIRSVVEGFANALLFSGRSIRGWFRVPSRALGRLIFRLHRTTITLSMETGVARAVAFKGKKVVAWGSVELDEPLGPPGGEGEPPVEQPAPLKILL